MADRRPVSRSLRLIASALALCAVAAGCGTGPTASPLPSSPGPSGGSESAAPSAVARPSAAAASTPSTPAPSATTRLMVVDAGLLAILPERIAGVPIVASAETAAEIASDLSLGRSASAIAVGIALDPGDSGGDDLAIVSVIRLRQGVFSDAFFAGWRTSYDAAACAPAGGVSGHRQEVVGAKAVEVTACTQGATLYHVHLPGDVLVSITAAGPGKFGELVLAGLRE